MEPRKIREEMLGIRERRGGMMDLLLNLAWISNFHTTFLDYHVVAPDFGHPLHFLSPPTVLILHGGVFKDFLV